MTASPSPSATLAPAPKSPVIETLAIKQQCLSIEAELPESVRPHGKAIIWDSFKGGNSYFWNFATKQREDIPGIEKGYSVPFRKVSPDNRWLAYTNQSGNKLSILGVNDQQSRDIPVDLSHPFSILYWSSNQTFLIWDYHDVYLVDKDKGIQGKVLGDYQNNIPDFSSRDSRGLLEFDPTLKRLVYHVLNAFNLYDVEIGKVIQTIPAMIPATYTDMEWTADGNYFYMQVDSNKTKVPGNPGDKLLIMNRNGIPIEWLGIKWDQNPKLPLFISGVSVSPDQHYLSFWMAPYEGSFTYKWSLVVVDLFSKTAKDYCIEQISDALENRPPRWSPDGTQLLMESGPQEEHRDMVLVDVTTEKAYLVTKDAIPVDWMIDK
jgi:hypothetical protein